MITLWIKAIRLLISPPNDFTSYNRDFYLLILIQHNQVGRVTGQQAAFL